MTAVDRNVALLAVYESQVLPACAEPGEHRPGSGCTSCDAYDRALW